MLKILSAGFLVLLLLFGSGQAMADDEFIIALESDITRMDPIGIQDATTSQVAFQVMERLLARDYDGNLVPALATDFEPNEQGDEWTFFLREGVTFHDGSTFDAHVAKWHFDRARGEDSNFRGQFSIVEDVEVVDDYKIKFYLERPSAAFIDNTIMTNAGYIPSMQAYEEKGEDFGYEPVGTGPFMWYDWEPGEEINLVRNDNWWGDGPLLGAVTYRVIPEASTQIVELETGGVHLVTRGLQEDVQRIMDRPEFEVVTSPAYRNRHFLLQQEKEPFNDILVRQAVSYAIDMKTIVEILAYPLMEPAVSLIPDASWAFTDDLVDYGYDPDKAEELLLEAGYTRASNGKFEKDGETLEIEILCPDGRYFMDKQISEAVRHQLVELGLDIRITIQEWGAFLDRAFAGDFQMAYLGWNQSSPEPSLFTDALVKTGGRANDAGISHEELDELLIEAMKVPDIEERKVLYAEAQRIINENAWFIFIGNESMVWMFPANVQGFNPSPAQSEDLTQIYFSN